MVYITDLSKRSRIKITGQGTEEFLQSICSNDLKALKQGFGLKAAFLDRFGKVLAVSSIYKVDDWALLESDLLCHAKLLKYLSERSEFAKCKVEDIKDAYKLFSVIGFQDGFMDLKLEKNQIIQKQLGPGIALIAKNCFLSRLDFFIPTEYSDGFPEFLYRKEGAEQVNTEEYEKFRIEQGIPEFGKDYDESYIVLELGLDGLINYEKGCYTGQEVVARMKAYSGQIARKIVKLSFSPESLVGREDKLFKDGKEAGIITSIGQGLCLATVKKDFFEGGTELQSSKGVLKVL
ncbi:MAG: hypothetical protein HY512_02700 [Candidatus Aenigmarchaeota archaeon]|nr:hypothetical protein [Candidatus Aenigmarchaeota archaeon]